MQVDIVLIVAISLVVIAVAYGLGVYFRRRADDQPMRPPTATPAAARRPSASPAPARGEAPDRELRVVINWLLSQAFEQTGIRVADDKLAYDRIVAVARKAVEALKTQPSFDISLPFLTADASGPKHLEARLTQDMFAELVKY